MDAILLDDAVSHLIEEDQEGAHIVRKRDHLIARLADKEVDKLVTMFILAGLARIF